MDKKSLEFLLSLHKTLYDKAPLEEGDVERLRYVSNKLYEEIDSERDNVIRGPVLAYAIARESALNPDLSPNEIRPKNIDAVMVVRAIDTGVSFHGYGANSINHLRDYVDRKFGKQE